MIKAVFFDWFNTLARFEPPREELYYNTFKEFGIELSPKDILRGLLAADQDYFAENAKRPIRERSPGEQVALFISYPRAMLAQAKMDAPTDLPAKVIQKLMPHYKTSTMVLFEDVLPAMKSLKERKLTLGLLTNAETRTVSALCDKYGLTPYLNFMVTSQEAGAEKPAPAIFLMALKKAGVKPAEAVHVGDQYAMDVTGARGVGINPIFIDRYEITPDIKDCPRITRLSELQQYL